MPARTSERTETPSPAEYVDRYPCPLQRARALSELANELNYLPPGHATLRAVSVVAAKDRRDCAGAMTDTQIADYLGISQPALSRLLTNHKARQQAAKLALLEQHP